MWGLLNLDFKQLYGYAKGFDGKADSIQEMMGNMSREIEIQRENNKKKLLEIKNTVTKSWMPFEGLIRSCMDEKRISELEDLTGETSKTENQREKDWTKQ